MDEKKETTKIDGISAQINLSPGSETHRRFAELMREAGATTARSFVEMLMDAYENPKSDPALTESIEKFHTKIDELNGEIGNYQNTLRDKDTEIADLKKQLEEAQKMANDNAVNGLGKQAQIEDLQKQLEGAIVIKPNMAEAYFMKQMADKCEVPVERMLRRLFWDDLNNPRANNFKNRRNKEVSTPSDREIRSVVNQLKEELKQQQNA